jgi:hypothetical protein
MPKAVCVLLGTAGVTGTITFEEGPSGARRQPFSLPTVGGRGSRVVGVARPSFFLDGWLRCASTWRQRHSRVEESSGLAVHGLHKRTVHAHAWW